MHDIRILKMAKIISSMNLKVIAKFISKYTCKTLKQIKKTHIQEKEAEYGSWFSYSQTARAMILRSTQNTVKDKDSLYYLMR